MRKTLEPIPRRFSMLTAILILNSHLYSTGGWLATGVGSGLCWFGVLDGPTNWIVIIFGGIFLFAGLYSLQLSYRQGIRTLSLMTNGRVAYGRLLSSADETEAQGKKLTKFAGEKLGISEEEIEKLEQAYTERKKEEELQSIVMDYVFEFSDTSGEKHTVKTKIKYIDRDRIEDEEEELIIYDEKNPTRAIIYDAIGGAPKILPHGGFAPADMSQYAVLILPTIVLMMNGLLFLYFLR